MQTRKRPTWWFLPSLVPSPLCAPTSQKVTATPPPALLCAFDASGPIPGTYQKPTCGLTQTRKSLTTECFIWGLHPDAGPDMDGHGRPCPGRATLRPSFLFRS